MPVSLKDLKRKDAVRQPNSYADFGIDAEVGELIDFLHEDEQSSSGFITKKRILANRDKWGLVINQYLCYPDLFADLITPPHSEFTLYPFQRIIMRCMARKAQTYCVFSRGTSKSFCGFLERYIHSDLTPRHRGGIIAGTRKQAASIAKEKIIDDLWNKFPFLGNEMQKRHVAGKYLDAYTAGADYARFGFRNGSWLDVASDRGLRRESVMFEEIIEQDPTFVNEIAIPWTNKPRSTSLGRINPNEPQAQKIFVTTAGYQGTYAYDKLIQTLIMSVIQPDRYIVLTGDYKIPLYHGLIQQSEITDKLNDPTFNKASFDREYMSIWSDAPTGAAFRSSTITALRKVKRVELENKINPSSTPEDFYVIALDVAKDGDAKTDGMVARVQPKQYAFTYKIVNLFQIDTTDFHNVANELKRLIILYNPRLVIWDANGVGAGIRDWMNKPTTSPDGFSFPGYGIINPPDSAKQDLILYPNDRTICYEIKSGGQKGSDIHNFLFSRISNGSIVFPISKGDAVDLYQRNKSFMELSERRKIEILRPYQLMDLAEVQLRNLDILEDTTVGSRIIKVSRRNDQIQKDFFSALEYLVYGTNQYIELNYYKQRLTHKNSILDAIIVD